MKRFHIVHFIEDNTVAIVPNCWIESKFCWWPPATSDEKVTKMVLNFDEPKEHWIKLPIKLLCSTDNYQKAKRKLKEAEDTNASNLSSESSDCEIRTKKKNKETCFHGANDDDILLPVMEENGECLSSRSHTEATPSSSRSHTEATPSRSRSDTAVPSRSRSDTAVPCRSTSPENDFFDSPASFSSKELTSERAFRKIFRMLEDQKEDIAELRSMFQAQFRPIEASVPESYPLPVNNPENLAAFDEHLKNKTIFSQFCSYFTSFGGVTHSSLIRRTLQTIMTNNVSMMYNWKGSGGTKLGFEQFQNIIKVISASVRNHPRFEKITQHEVETVIKKWLAYAKDRDGGRSRRAKKN